MDLKINSVVPPEDFSKEIEEIVYMADCDYREALLEWAERTGTEVETVAEFVKKHPDLKDKLQVECEDALLVERTPRLDF
jgi:hypothetical protein